MVDPADAAFVDQLPREGDGRHAAVVEPDGIDLAALARGRGHRRASAPFIASGFSQATILPASNAARAIS